MKATTLFVESKYNIYADANREEFYKVDLSLGNFGYYKEDILVAPQGEEEKEHFFGDHIREAKKIIKTLFK